MSIVARCLRCGNNSVKTESEHPVNGTDDQTIAKLMRSAEQGDEAAVRELMRYFDPHIRRCSGVGGAIDDDVAQSIRLSLWCAFTTGTAAKHTSGKHPSIT